MPLVSRGPKTLWMYTGVFVFIGVLVIVMTPQAVPLAVFLPSMYCIYSDKTPGIKPAVISLIPAVLLVLIPAYFHSTILYLCLVACGILLTRYIRKRNIGLSVLVPAGLIFLLLMSGIYILAVSEGTSFSAVISKWVGHIMTQVSSVYENMLSPDEMMDFKMGRHAMEERIAAMFPALMATSFAFVMWLNLVVVSAIKKDIVLRTWKCPDWVVGIFIIAGLFSVIRIDALSTVGLNILIMVSYVYFFQGLGIVASFMAEHDWTRIVRWGIYILILSQIYMMIIVSALGLFDTWFDFRTRIRKSKGDER